MRKKRRITKSYYDYFCNTKMKYIRSIIANYLKSIKKLYLMESDDINEFIQMGFIQLLYSMIYFDTSKGSFNTYLYTRINGYLKHMNLGKEILGTELPFDTLLVTHTDYQLPIYLEELTANLTDQEKQVLKICIMDGCTLREASGVTGLSFTSVFNIKNRALDKIRENYHMEI